MSQRLKPKNQNFETKRRKHNKEKLQGGSVEDALAKSSIV